VRKWPSESARKWLQELVTAASNHSNLKAIVAVGSAVRDVPSITDLDLIVIYRETKPYFTKLPLDVDVRVYEHTEIQEKLSRGHDLLGWAIKLGCVVYERHGYWTALRNRWIHRLPLPSFEEAIVRANRTKKLYCDLVNAGDSDAAKEQLICMLTHIARARLIGAGIFPASRPELPQQLRGIGERRLAKRLSNALSRTGDHLCELADPDWAQLPEVARK
jgi:hypothetical protein